LLNVFACLLLLGSTTQLLAQGVNPVLFYSDLDSGPATGGPGGNGAFVCVYGENFGPTGTLTIGGATASILLWTDPGAPYAPAHYAKACGQIASSATSSPGIQLTTLGGSSNTLPFAVRSGSIYFVSPSGSDTNGDGSYSNPWATITYCKNTFSPGDICVAGVSSTDTITVTKPEPQSWGTVVGLLLNSCGTAGNPKAIVAYPGNSVTYDLHRYYDYVTFKGGGRPIQDYNSSSYPNNCNTGSPIAYWTIAGLSFNGNSYSALSSLQTRFVDNDLQCTGRYCDGSAAGLTGGAAGNLMLLGNRFHDIGCGLHAPCATTGYAHPSKLYHTVYLGAGDHLEVAYNDINGNGGACRGLQFYSYSGYPEQDIQVYNNVIHNTACDAMNLATVNPAGTGGVNVYNNIVYNAGIGPNPEDGMAHYSCFYSSAASCTTGGATGAIQIFNNTFYNCGAAGLVDAGTIGAVNCTPPVTVALYNNLIVQPVSTLPYQAGGTGSLVSATNNDCFGHGEVTCPTPWGGSEYWFDPLFMNASGYDFHLQANSPAIALSTTPWPQVVDAVVDADGVPRSSPYSLGAYEAVTSGSSSGKAPGQITCPSPVIYTATPTRPCWSNSGLLVTYNAVSGAATIDPANSTKLVLSTTTGPVFINSATVPQNSDFTAVALPAPLTFTTQPIPVYLIDCQYSLTSKVTNPAATTTFTRMPATAYYGDTVTIGGCTTDNPNGPRLTYALAITGLKSTLAYQKVTFKADETVGIKISAPAGKGYAAILSTSATLVGARPISLQTNSPTWTYGKLPVVAELIKLALAAGSAPMAFTDRLPASGGYKITDAHGNDVTTVPANQLPIGSYTITPSAAKIQASGYLPYYAITPVTSSLTVAPNNSSSVLKPLSTTVTISGVKVGKSGTASVTVTNKTGESLNIGASVPAGTPFAVSVPSTCAVTSGLLPNGGTCNLTVTFKPTASGAATPGTLTITASDANDDQFSDPAKYPFVVVPVALHGNAVN
jgi:hypothetical protein